MGASRRRAAAVLLANLSPWKEEMPLSALDLHLPAHTSCTGFNSTGTQRDGYDASPHGAGRKRSCVRARAVV